MKLRPLLFWLLALLITLAAFRYQRLTGPTYPLQGETAFGAQTLRYELIRTNDQRNAPVEIAVPDSNIQGLLVYKRYKTQDPWIEIPMMRQGDTLLASLPLQPPAGKLEYYLRLSRQETTITVPQDRDVVIRYKGNVPIWILLPHILCISLAMLFSTRAGLEALPASGRPKKMVYAATGLLFAGGMIFGPLVQYYAFGALWTGVPFGWDLTDNKTLIALIGWIIPVIALYKGRSARGWIVFAALLMLLVFSIPHSTLGSELNYQTGQIGTANVGQ